MNNTNNDTEQWHNTSFMDEVETYTTYKLASYIDLYWLPILVPIGLIGNTLSFLIMIKPNNRKMSTCIYMAAISVNYNIMMILAFYTWIRMHDSHPMECRFVVYLVLTAMQNSILQVMTVIDVVIFVYICNILHLFITKKSGSICLGYAVGGTITTVYSCVIHGTSLYPKLFVYL